MGTPNGTILAANGECIQDDPSRPPWCYVDKATCSVPPPVRNGSAWDYCRGAPLSKLLGFCCALGAAHCAS